MTNKIIGAALLFSGFAAGLCWDRPTPETDPIVEDLPARVIMEKSLGIWNVSAYCLCEICIDIPEFRDGLTASGVPAIGAIVAAPPEMPFGTRLSIPGYGEAVVQDRGGSIKGRRLDLLFPTHQAALNWGRQHIEVKEL